MRDSPTSMLARLGRDAFRMCQVKVPMDTCHICSISAMGAEEDCRRYDGLSDTRTWVMEKLRTLEWSSEE
jgi:hypothetical protein